jgi:hypothetical protein
MYPYLFPERGLKWAGHQSRLIKIEFFQNLTYESTGNIPLEKARHTWENNIRMDIQAIRINVRN